MSNKILIEKKTKIKGEDGHKTFSIRINDKTVEKLDGFATATNRSRNEIVSILLDYAIDHFDVE